MSNPVEDRAYADNGPPVRLGPVRTWIVNHDRSLLFAFLYVTLTIVLSVFISYFWLLAIVGVHIVLEWLKKGYLGYRRGKHRIAWTLWDVKFDLALVCLAFALLSYTGINAGVAGAQSATRAGILGSRFGALSTRFGALAAPLAELGQYLARFGQYFARFGQYFARFGKYFARLGIKVVDVFFSARVALFRKADMAREASRSAVLDEEQDQVPAYLPWQRRLSGGDWFAISVITVNIVAVLSAPLITDHSYTSLLQSLAVKLHPWPG